MVNMHKQVWAGIVTQGPGGVRLEVRLGRPAGAQGRKSGGGERGLGGWGERRKGYVVCQSSACCTLHQEVGLLLGVAPGALLGQQAADRQDLWMRERFSAREQGATSC